jgi:hypothetical protein
MRMKKNRQSERVYRYGFKKKTEHCSREISNLVFYHCSEYRGADASLDGIALMITFPLSANTEQN